MRRPRWYFSGPVSGSVAAVLIAILASACTRQDAESPSIVSPPTASAPITEQQKSAAMHIWCEMTPEFAREMMMEQDTDGLRKRAINAAHQLSERVAEQLDVPLARAAEIINLTVIERGGRDGASAYCESHADADATP